MPEYIAHPAALELSARDYRMELDPVATARPSDAAVPVAVRLALSGVRPVVLPASRRGALRLLI